jgi:hypothetical protein
MPAFGSLLRPAYVHLTNVGRKSVKFVLPRLHCVWIMRDDCELAVWFRSLLGQQLYKLDIHGSVHHDIITKITKKMQLFRLIYCSLTALHFSSNTFAHHQEHFNCIYSFWYYSRLSLPVGIMDELSSNSSTTPAGCDIRE